MFHLHILIFALAKNGRSFDATIAKYDFYILDVSLHHYCLFFDSFLPLIIKKSDKI